MLSEWQRVVSSGDSRKSNRKPADGRSLSSPSSPTSSEPTTPRLLQKRSRALADVDGDNSVTRQRKKRRLRRDLITSRLSRPYASPATHIISRNAVRLGIWTGRRYIGRNAFRKAAILNSMRRERLDDTAEMKTMLPPAISLKTIHERMDPDISDVGNKSLRVVTNNNLAPRQAAIVPNLSSPPVRTNYDIFDEEDSDPDADDGPPFDILDSSKTDYGEPDELCPFNDISMELAMDSPAKEDRAMEHFCRQSDSLMGGCLENS